IGMVERNEANAIIVHGTMCLIRRAALEAAGSWSSDTIVEDSDLGLTILELGWRALYTNRRYGHGLLPDTFEAYKKQRHRWAYGGVQIMKKHWRRFLPGASRLSADQKREYALGWLNWLGAESIGVVVAILNLLWVPVVAVVGIAIADKTLTVPIIAAFLVSLMHFVMLYRLRVAIPVGQMTTSVFAAMSVQWTVARAVCDGLVKDHLPFARTAKGGLGRRARIPGVLGGHSRFAARAWGDHFAGRQCAGGARDQRVRRRAAGAEPAVPGSGGAGCAGKLARQRVRVLGRRRAAVRRGPAAPRPRGPPGVGGR